MAVHRRTFIRNAAVSAAGSLLYSRLAAAIPDPDPFEVPQVLQLEMYEKAMSIARQKIRGGADQPVYKKPFVDAAFSNNIFYWDTCFIACYAKYHQSELPIINALDNFYGLMEPDGYICREFTKEGKPMWPKEHPVSMNPPLLAFAELELYAYHHSVNRLKAVYPKLKKHFEYWVKTYRCEDHLFYNDAFGSGMDNIERFPRGWTDDGMGIHLTNLYPEIFVYDGLSPAWNKQGRMVDVSAQMALFARNLIEIAQIIQHPKDIPAYQQFYRETAAAINQHCWNEQDGFYYDLGYGTQIQRKHVGMFWVLLAGVVPAKRLPRLLAHLTNPNEFWRTIPVPGLSADDPQFEATGGYWRGGVWVPTNYMVIRGLMYCKQTALAKKLARQYYWGVAEVYKKTGTFWECYAPDSTNRGDESRKDFCGWTGIVPITLYHEFIKGR